MSILRSNIKKKILILGASSDIGIELINCLSNNFYIYAHCSNNFRNLNKLKRDNLEIIKSDFKKVNNKNYKNTISKKFNHSYDYILNLIGFIDKKSYENTDINFIFKSLKVNTIIPMFIERNAIKKMLKKKYGRILNCSSIGVKFGGGKNTFNYSLSKHCLEFIPNSYKIWAKKNVLINNLRIGLTNTKIHKKKNLSKNKLSKRIRQVPMQRMASTKEVASFILNIMDEKNSFMTGQTISISGGE
tara:strand:+ start:1288 stop:2022 length:735 start_codon:yes stop_codon:yes gene_type:complete